MLNIQVRCDTTRKLEKKKRFVATYGNVKIVDIIAENEKEAEEKFIFALAYGLRDKTIEFDLNNVRDAK